MAIVYFIYEMLRSCIREVTGKWSLLPRPKPDFSLFQNSAAKILSIYRDQNTQLPAGLNSYGASPLPLQNISLFLCTRSC